MGSVQQTKLALAIVAFSSVVAGRTGLYVQDPRLAALETLRAMKLDSADGAATLYFRPDDRARALVLHAMMQETRVAF